MENQTASPNVFINPPVPTTPSGKRFNTKIILAVLGLIVLVAIILGVKTLWQRSAGTNLTSSTNESISSGTVQETASGTISLESVSQEYKVGQVVPVTIKLNTGGRPTSGTDVVIKFNPNSLEATGSSIVTGTLYPDYPLTKADSALKTIRISGLSATAGTDFSGEGLFATINFKAKSAGTTPLILDFTPKATADSNILETAGGTDWLKEVNNLELVIR